MIENKAVNKNTINTINVESLYEALAFITSKKNNVKVTVKVSPVVANGKD